MKSYYRTLSEFMRARGRNPRWKSNRRSSRKTYRRLYRSGAREGRLLQSIFGDTPEVVW